MKGFLLVLLVMQLQPEHLHSFNFDVNTPVFKQLPRDVYFGYSIAQHMVKQTRVPYILVGAPRDSVVNNGGFYNMSGALYRCPITLGRFDDCEQISVDFLTRKSDEVATGEQQRNNYLDENLKEQFKGRQFENQWFGVSVASTGDGLFSACAHKYVHYYNFTTRDEHAAYGACYRFSNDFVQEYKHVPCLVYSHSVNTFYFNNYAYCQAGTSLGMVEDVTLLPGSVQDTYMSYGMPGALNFRGLVGVKTVAGSKSNMHNFEYVYKNKSLCKFDIENDRPMSDGYCPSLWDKYSYTGMSHVLIRRYLNNPKLSLVVSGAPREQLYGMARLMTIMFDVSFGQVTKLLNLTLRGEHKGSYFGFSMAGCDINGDRADDLIIGAPYYSRKQEPNVGAVYIYLNHRQKGFSQEYALNFTGTIRSLFGISIACLGDIDKDGFNDFAVGAPYETNPIKSANDQRAGAVYIFRGHSDISRIKLSQKIYASDISLNSVADSNGLKSFGYSLSGGMDMDANSYPDLAVGSHQSNAVVLLRTRPIIYINAFVRGNETIQDIDQKLKRCKSEPSQANNDLVCFEIELCFGFSNTQQLSDITSLPRLIYRIEAEPNVTDFSTRVYFTSANTKVLNRKLWLNLNADSTCDMLQVNIKKDNNDFLRPIKFLVNFTLEKEELDQDRLLSDIKNQPIIHQDLNSFQFDANFKKECGEDKKCITDLKLSAYFADLIIGDDQQPLLSFKESDTVTITVVLENNDTNSEPAYTTQIDIDFDDRLDFIKKQDQEPNGFICAINYKKKLNSLICKMTNDISGVPFPADTSVKFNLTFSSTRLYRYANITSRPNVGFSLSAKTLSTDTDLSNNDVLLVAKLKIRANLFLYGKRTPEQVFYSDSSVIKGESAIKNFDQIGPIIEHTYIINNGGPFSVNFFQLIIDWPYESKLVDFNPSPNSPIRYMDGKHLLYLTEKPTKIPNNHPINVICSSYQVDPLKLSDSKMLAKRRKRSNEFDGRDDEDDVMKSPLSHHHHRSMPRVAVIDCFSDTAYCHRINCSFYGDFNKDDTISLKFTARLWNSTLVEDFYGFEKVLIKSNGKLILSDGIHDDKLPDNENSVTTVAYARITGKIDKDIPYWIYIVSVLIGLFILVICIFGFYMLGFFERKRFGDEKYIQENEKLNKNPY